jgi:mono/diheme cytochrome c family protein
VSSRLIMCDALAVVVLALTPALASAQQPAPGPSVNPIADGSYLFRTYCAACHGASARGDGPLAASLRRKPPNLTEISRRHNNVYPGDLVFQIIDGRQKVPGHGGPDMPVWGDAFQRSLEGGSDQAVRARIQALVTFLESIQTRETP